METIWSGRNSPENVPREWCQNSKWWQLSWKHLLSLTRLLHLEEILRKGKPHVLVSFPVIVITLPDEHKLWDKRYILVHSSKAQFLLWENQHSENLKHLIMSHLPSGAESDECLLMLIWHISGFFTLGSGPVHHWDGSSHN